MLTRTFEQTFSKLAIHIRKHFGVDIHFVELKELATRAGDVLSRLETGDKVELDEKIYVPLIHDKKFIGATEIQKKDLDKITYERLNDTIRLLLESKMEGMGKIEMLKDIENATYNNERKSNVIVMNEYRQDRFSVRELGSIDNTSLNFPFIIEGRNPDDIHKMAFELHYQSGRYAFLSIDDLDWNTLRTPADINNLGAMTMFVPDLNNLPMAIQEILLEYMRAPRTKDSPQIIAGTCLPVAELKKSPRMKTGLLEALLVGYVCVTEPFANYRNTDWVEFFFESLTQRPQLDV